MRQRIKSSLLFVMSCALITVGCATNSVTGRSQFNFVSEQVAIEKGNDAYWQIIKKYREEYKVVDSGQIVDRVVGISNRLIDQAVSIYPSSSDWRWDIHVIEDESLNAWCLPGGKMAIHTGIIERLNLTDDEIAAIVGHEIAHALVGHGAERQSIQAASGIATALLAVAIGETNEQREAIHGAASIVAALALTLPYSREHESEADRVGVEIAARAGFDPSAATSLWQKMGKEGASSGSIDFFSTHPSSQKRENDLAALEPQMRPLMQQALDRKIHLAQATEWIGQQARPRVAPKRMAYLDIVDPENKGNQSLLDAQPGNQPNYSLLDDQIFTRKQPEAIAKALDTDTQVLTDPEQTQQRGEEVSLYIENSKGSEKAPEEGFVALQPVTLTCKASCPGVDRQSVQNLRQAIRDENWRVVYNLVAKLNVKSDSGYYWLGKAAKGLNNSNLARLYFDEASRLTGQVGFSCSKAQQFPCFGADLGSLASRKE